MSKGESKKLKICHILASHMEIGGLEKNVIDLATAQTHFGHTVSIITTEAMSEEFPESVNKVVVKLERSRRDPRLLWEIRRKLNEISPDIVHAHANKPGALIAKVRSKLNCRTVATVQNLKRDQSMFRHFDQVICASQMVADTLGEKESTVIYNAVELMPESIREKAKSMCPPFQNEDAESKLLISVVGRFVEAKGYDLLLDAMAQVPNSSLWMIGDGPLRGNLEAQIERLGLKERVWMPGFLDYAIGFMPLSDVFMISSRNEGGPYTLAEALRCETPVISTRVGYAPEFLDDFALCDEVSVEAIRDKLLQFAKDKEEYRSKMKSAYERASTGLDLNHMVRGVENVYQRALKES